MTIKRPMLAETLGVEDINNVEWPVLASPKVDGLRLLMHPELGPVTRSFKPLPNVYVREELQRLAGGSYLDGELLAVEEDWSFKTFNETQSAMMSRDGQPKFHFTAFDCFEKPDAPYYERYGHAAAHASAINSMSVGLLIHNVIHDADEFGKFVTACLERGFEGVVIRDQGGPYKSGRSTLRQGWMLKHKPWLDAEGIVIGFEELMHNDNPQEEDEFGLAKRSSHKSGKTAAGTMGALVLQTDWGILRVGTGFDAATRKLIWDRNEGFRPGDTVIPDKKIHERLSDLGRKVIFKYQGFGMQELPRFPVFKGFREEE